MERAGRENRISAPGGGPQIRGLARLFSVDGSFLFSQRPTVTAWPSTAKEYASFSSNLLQSLVILSLLEMRNFFVDFFPLFNSPAKFRLAVPNRATDWLLCLFVCACAHDNTMGRSVEEGLIGK